MEEWFLNACYIMSGHVVRDFSYFENMPLSRFIYLYEINKTAHAKN